MNTRVGLLGVLLLGVVSAYSDGAEVLKCYPAPAGAPRSDDYRVSVNGQSVDLYDAGDTRWGSRCTFGYFDFSGRVEVEISCKYPAPHSTGWEVLPRKYGIEPTTVKNGTIRFSIDQPMKLTFLTNQDYQGRVLHLFANALEQQVPQPDDPNVLYFGAGYYDIGADKDFTITLKDNQTLYLAGGAYVRGLVSATDATNITIRGRGILAQDRDLPRVRSIALTHCKGIDIQGIITNRDRDGWSGVIINSSDINIHDYKVVSPAIWSSDGMNLVNCQKAVYDDCFFRAGDDNIAIKGIGPRDPANKKAWAHIDPRSMPANADILVQNCIFWSDNNNAVVLGQETHAARYENITFRNCDILFVRDDQPIKAALAIVCLHATDYRNILFEDIRVGACGQLITVYYTEDVFGIPGDQSWSGEIDGVTFKNIQAEGAGSKLIRLEGWNDGKKIRRVTFDNVTIHGEKVSADSPYLRINQYVEDLRFK